MAEAARISVSSVQSIWKAHGLAPRPPLQALEQSRVRTQVRLVGRPAGPRRGAVGRREVADPGARPHPAWRIKEGCAGRHIHDYGRHGTTPCPPSTCSTGASRPLDVGATGAGARPPPQRHRDDRAGRQDRPRHPRQLAHEAAEGAGLAPSMFRAPVRTASGVVCSLSPGWPPLLSLKRDGSKPTLCARPNAATRGGRSRSAVCAHRWSQTRRYQGASCGGGASPEIDPVASVCFRIAGSGTFRDFIEPINVSNYKAL